MFSNLKYRNLKLKKADRGKLRLSNKQIRPDPKFFVTFFYSKQKSSDPARTGSWIQ